MQGEQGCAQGVVQATCGVWAQATQPPGSYHDFFGNGAERNPSTGQVYSMCSLQSLL